MNLTSCQQRWVISHEESNRDKVTLSERREMTRGGGGKRKTDRKKKSRKKREEQNKKGIAIPQNKILKSRRLMGGGERKGEDFFSSYQMDFIIRYCAVR